MNLNHGVIYTGYWSKTVTYLTHVAEGTAVLHRQDRDSLI